VRQHDVLSFQAHPEGRPTRVVLDEHGAAFRESRLSVVEEAARGHSTLPDDLLNFHYDHIV
jgi:hypothetical protein